jgi:hypothetical protein
LLWMDPVSAGFWPASPDQKYVNILYQTAVYAASVHADLDFL